MYTLFSTYAMFDMGISSRDKVQNALGRLRVSAQNIKITMRIIQPLAHDELSTGEAIIKKKYV